MLMTLRCVMTLTQGHFIKVNHIINNLHFIKCSTREEPLNFCHLYTKIYDCSLQINILELKEYLADLSSYN